MDNFGGGFGPRPMIWMGPAIPDEDVNPDKDWCGGKDWRYDYWEDSNICWKFIKARFRTGMGPYADGRAVHGRSLSGVVSVTGNNVK